MKKKLKRKGGDDSDGLVKKAHKRKKSLVEKIEGPSAADKLLPRTLEERMNARRVVVVLEKCPLEVVAPRKGAMELLNSDDHKGICAKTGRDLADVRPDITHQCLMALLDSPLNKVGKLLIYIHTAKNVLIEVHPSLRVPRTFKRFAGLCVELLQYKKIRAAGANETLMKVVQNPVEKYLPPGSRRFGMSVTGRKVKFRDFAAELDQQSADTQAPIVFCVGGVAHGDPVTEASYGANYVEESLCVSPYGLSAACVCSKICNESGARCDNPESRFEYLWGIC